MSCVAVYVGVGRKGRKAEDIDRDSGEAYRSPADTAPEARTAYSGHKDSLPADSVAPAQGMAEYWGFEYPEGAGGYPVYP